MSTIAKAAKTAKADYEILVTLKNGYPLPKVPGNMKVGETVHYKSYDGAVYDKVSRPPLPVPQSERK
jgi:hypothetical protein